VDEKNLSTPQYPQKAHTRISRQNEDQERTKSDQRKKKKRAKKIGGIKGIATLKTKKEFDRVYHRGRAYHSEYFVIFYLKAPEPRVGFVASKKVGKAVARNRAKRLLRALLLPFTNDLKSGHFVFVAKPKILEAKFGEIAPVFEQIIGKIVHD